MSKPKVLILTSVDIQLTDKGLEKFRDEEYEDEDNPREGSAAWFRKLNINPPKDLDTGDKNSELEEDDYYYVYGEVLLDLSDFGYVNYLDVNKASHVYTKSGRVFPVLETAEQIYEQIYDLKASFFQKLVDRIKIKLTRTNE